MATKKIRENTLKGFFTLVTRPGNALPASMPVMTGMPRMMKMVTKTSTGLRRHLFQYCSGIRVETSPQSQVQRES